MTALAVGGHVLGAIAGVQGALTQAVAAKFQGQVEAANAEAQADAYKFNSKVATQMARSTEQVAVAEAGDFRRAGSAALASRRAAAAAGGVSLSEGSPLMVNERILSEVEFGAARIINAGDIVSTRQLNEAELLQAQKRNATRKARIALQGGNLAAKAAGLGVYTAIAGGAVGVGNTLSQAGYFK